MGSRWFGLACCALLLACDDGGSESPTPLPDAGPDAAPQCGPGESRCLSNGQIEICVGGRFQLTDCPRGESCVDGACAPLGCVPDCAGRSCGDDGCGGRCGVCADGWACEGGTCTPPATDCGDGQCDPGEDCESCVADCACAPGEVCADGACSCTPDCAERACGDDGCGGSCGDCAEGECVDGACAPPGPECGDQVCEAGERCSTCPIDCGLCCGDGTCAAEDAENCATCPADCACEPGRECEFSSRSCEPLCRPACLGRACGDDGCGGTCGECPDGGCAAGGRCAPAPPACGDGTCDPDEDCALCPADCGPCCGDGVCAANENCATCRDDCACAANERCDPERRRCLERGCRPQCADRRCGPDGCGGVCGACGGGRLCDPEAGTCNAECAPLCDRRACGPDGCGGDCGGCSGDQVCSAAGACVEGCQPRCDGRACGGDGCGGVCGECPDGPCVRGACCAPDCAGRACGDDGCGGSCGACPAGAFCDPAGRCGDECVPACDGRACGPDGCGGICGECPDGPCRDGQCCAPDCAGRACGDDGCGGECGACPDDRLCEQATGRCVEECEPNCLGRACGDDGCGGECGPCPPGQACTAEGACVGQCIAQCDGRECGDDQCGSVCGICAAGERCDDAAGACCAPDCAGRECGRDGCGGVCGVCGDPAACTPDGECCAPACDGRECGPDGCGGLCGDCPDGPCRGGLCCVPDCAGRACGDDGCGGRCGACGPDQQCDDGGQCGGGCDCPAGFLCSGPDRACRRPADLCGPESPGGLCAPGELCREGACAALDVEIVCDDLNPCTVDLFDAGRDRCVSAPDPMGRCDDGDPCTAELCADGECVGEPVANCVSPPEVDDFASPTNAPVFAMAGDKPAGSSLLIDGFQALPPDAGERWALRLNLVPGENVFQVSSALGGRESQRRTVRVVFDNQPPTVRVSPDGGSFIEALTATVATDEPATVYFTHDGGTPSARSERFFESARTFRVFADARLRFRARDRAGNWSAVVEARFSVSSADNRWSAGAPVARGVSRAGVARLGGAIFFAGGVDAIGPTNVVFGIDEATGEVTNFPPLPTTRTRLGLVAVPGGLLAFGGDDDGIALSDLVVIDPNFDNAWLPRAAMSTGRIDPGAVGAGSFAYAIGGRDIDGDALASVERYDLVQDRWVERAPMPTARSGAATYVDPDGQIWVIGGIDRDGRASGAVEVYDPLQDEWRARASMPTGRANAAMVPFAVGDDPPTLLVVGGYDGDGAPIAATEQYDVARDAWRIRSPLPEGLGGPVGYAFSEPLGEDGERAVARVLGGESAAGPSLASYEWRLDAGVVVAGPALPANRFHHKAYAYRDRIYVFGGRSFQAVTEGWALNAETGEYADIAPIPGPQDRAGSARADNRFYLFGGVNAFNVPLTVTRMYDPDLDQWRDRLPMPSARADTAAVYHRGEIWVIGGTTRDNLGVQSASALVEIYDPQTNRWRVGPVLPAARVGAVAGSNQEALTVIGGVGADGQPIAGAVRYVDGAWVDGGGAQDEFIVAYGAAVYGGDDGFTVFGGRADGEPLAQALSYSLDRGEPRRVGSVGVPARDRMAAATHYGRVYLFGGNEGLEPGPDGVSETILLDGRCYNGLQDAGEEPLGNEPGVFVGGGCGLDPRRGVRPKLAQCGRSSRNVNQFIRGDLVGVVEQVVQTCVPDAETQAMLVPRAGAPQFQANGAAIRAWVEEGGIVITEFNISDEVFNALFAPERVVQGTRNGNCSDTTAPQVQLSPNDPFWQRVPFVSANGSTGCGYSLNGFPGVTPLGGWNANAWSHAYRDLGAGRVYFVETDWQDGQPVAGPALDIITAMIASPR